MGCSPKPMIRGVLESVWICPGKQDGQMLLLLVKELPLKFPCLLWKQLSLISQLQIQDVCVCVSVCAWHICKCVIVFVWLEEEVDYLNVYSAWFLELTQPI